MSAPGDATAPAAGGLSLTVRLVARLGAVLVLGALVVSLAAYLYGRRAAQQSYDRLLIGAANQIAESISIRNGELTANLPVSAFQLLSLAPEDRIAYAVFAPDGSLITGDAWLKPLPDDKTFADGRFGDDPMRLVQVVRRMAERNWVGLVRVEVGQTTRARDHLAGEIIRSALGVTAAVGLAICLMAGLAVRTSLRPLRRIETALAMRKAHDLTPLHLAVPQEIESLVATLNRFIGRLDRQFTVMRDLIADTSHQLRTPIAALRVQAELAREEKDPEQLRAILARIHARTGGLGRLTDQLLNHALIIHRADSIVLDRLDLRRVAMQAVEEIDHDLQSAEADLILDLPDDPVWAMGDALSLREACKNLAGNALRHGRPPVRVEAREVNREAILAVIDAGEGIPEAHWADAGRRYQRASGVTARSAGLGLAIAAAVARAQGGRLVFSRPTTGGFEVALVLPAPPDEGTGA